MADLKDYSGPFTANIQYTDYSKDLLLNMLETFSKLYLLMDGLWHSEVAQKYGEDVAWKLEDNVWVKLAVYEPTRIAQTLGISVHGDVDKMMKLNQWFAGFWHTLYPHKIELNDKNHAILTCSDCPQLKYLEQKGDLEAIRMCCEVQECKIWTLYAKTVNPKMKFRALKLPPRKSGDEIACQVEFYIEP